MGLLWWRLNWPVWKDKISLSLIIKPGVNRVDVKCPLTPLEGGNFPHFLMGHRRYMYGGHAKTSKPDKRRLKEVKHQLGFWTINMISDCKSD
ncbi:ATP-dependent helicase smarcad1, variant 2 [Trifolium repens]|nr:ATP-dependent helicase smarcad1, variant 2 [Trifolium repens]